MITRVLNSRVRMFRKLTGLLAIPLLVTACFAFVFSYSQQSYAAVVPESCYDFDAGTGTINAYDPLADLDCVTDIDIPATIGGVSVTAIGNGAFAGANITSVHFPSSITSIGYGSFNGVVLTDVTIAAAGDLTIYNGSFGTYQGTTLSITAAGDLTIYESFSSMPNLSSLVIDAGENLVINNSFKNSTTLASVSIHANDNMTLLSAFQSITLGLVDLSAGGNTTISSSSFSNVIATTFSVDTDGALLVDSAITGSGSSIELLELTSGSTLTVQGGGVYNIPQLESLSLSSGAGLMSLQQGAGQGLAGLVSLTISAPSGLTLDSGQFSGSPLLATADLTTSGDVVLGSSVFSNTSLTSFAVHTSGSISTAGTTLANNSLLETLTLDAGTSLQVQSGSLYSTPLLSDVTLHSGTTTTVSQGVFAGKPSLQSAEIVSGGSMTLLDSAFQASTALTSLTLSSGGAITIAAAVFYNAPISNFTINATGAVTIGQSAFQGNQISTLTLPSTTTSIGDSSFMYGTQLTTVNLQNATPTIAANAFSFAGIKNTDPATYANVRYVPIYMTNPAGYTDTIYPTRDVNSDGTNDIAGGYLINPASFETSYENTSGTTITPGSTAVGRLSSGTLLTDYRVSSNPTEDLTAYFHQGDSYSFTAPAVSGYVTPAAITGIYGSGANPINFVYTLPVPLAPNTGLESAATHPIALWSLFIIAGSSFAFIAYTLYRKTN